MTNNVNETIVKVASENKTSVKNVLSEMDKSIEEARRNPDPEIQAFWRDFPSKHKTPTPEEVITYLTNQLKKDRATGTKNDEFR